MKIKRIKRTNAGFGIALLIVGMAVGAMGGAWMLMRVVSWWQGDIIERPANPPGNVGVPEHP